MDQPTGRIWLVEAAFVSGFQSALLLKSGGRSVMTIRAERNGYTATVTIANPESLNALFLADLQTLAELWDQLEADDRIRVVVVTGEADRAFCSGANLKELIPILTDDLRKSKDPYRTLSDMTSLHRAFLKQ